jgi:putative GTP pyrophosphokinase
MSSPRPSDDLQFLEDNSLLYPMLKTEAIYSLEQALRAKGLKVHSVIGRVKKRESIEEKIRSKGITADLQASLRDIVGLRVVALFRDDLKVIGQVIEETFCDVIEDDKLAKQRADEFGYMSVHYFCKLGDKHVGGRYTQINNFEFEIQTRTMLMDAWANVSHTVKYKGEYNLPPELEKDLNALSGLFHVADTQFQQLYAKAVTDTVTEAEGSWTQSSSRLTARSVNKLIGEIFPGQEQPEDLEERGTDAVDLIRELKAAGYESIEQLRKALLEARDRAYEIQETSPPMGKPGEKYYAIGLARVGLADTDPAFAAVYSGYDGSDEFGDFVDDADG